MGCSFLLVDNDKRVGKSLALALQGNILADGVSSTKGGNSLLGRGKLELGVLTLHGNHLTAYLDEGKAKLGENTHLGYGTGGSVVKFLTVGWVFATVLGTHYLGGEIVKTKKPCALVYVIYTLCGGVHGKYLQVGTDYRQGQRGKSCAAANVDNICALFELIFS